METTLDCYSEGKRVKNIISIDVEDWFHILGRAATPKIERWPLLESRLEPDVERLLTLFDTAHTRVTFFWLGWCARQYKSLLRRCHAAGHEIGCHTYAHSVCHTIGPTGFCNEIREARLMLEDVIGDAVTAFRSPGLTTNSCGCSTRCFGLIREAGYLSDSSTWCRAPVSMTETGQPGVYTIETDAGPLFEIPVSAMTLGGRAIMPVGGGHLRILPSWWIHLRIRQLHGRGLPFVVYIHPRDLDPDGPCLPLGRWGRFKFYVNRKTTEKKLAWLCNSYGVCTIRELAALADNTTRPAKSHDLVALSRSAQAIQIDSLSQGVKDEKARDRSDRLPVFGFDGP